MGNWKRSGDGISPGGYPVSPATAVQTDFDPFFGLKALSRYSSLSVRTLREYLKDPIHPLPHYRVGGKILVRQSEFDAWISHYRQAGNAAVERIVDEVIDSVAGQRYARPVLEASHTRRRRNGG